VNTYRTSSQLAPSIAAHTGGSFVVVWQGFGQEASGSAVFGQRYDAAGAPVGAEFQVNSSTTGNQRLAKVAALAGGGFVVVWASPFGDGDDYGIFGRRFDANGLAGPEFQVNTYTNGRQVLPAVATDGAGNFTVVWQSNGQEGASYEVYAQRYDVSGATQGNEFRVNTSTTGRQANASVAVDPSGSFVVAWNTNDGANGYQVAAQRFDATGTPAGAEFQVTSPVGTSNARDPSLAGDVDGNFVVVWTSSYYGGSSTGIFGRRYDAGGAARGDEFRVNAFTIGPQMSQAVASDLRGNFVVVWQSGSQDGHSYGVFGRTFGRHGAPTGFGEFMVNGYTTGSQVSPSVAMDGRGLFIVAWMSYGQDGSAAGVFARRFQSAVIFRDGFE